LSFKVCANSAGSHLLGSGIDEREKLEVLLLVEIRRLQGGVFLCGGRGDAGGFFLFRFLLRFWSILGGFLRSLCSSLPLLPSRLT